MKTKEQELREKIIEYLNILDENQYANVKSMCEEEFSLNRLVDVIIEKFRENPDANIIDIVDEIEMSMYFD